MPVHEQILYPLFCAGLIATALTMIISQFTVNDRGVRVKSIWKERFFPWREAGWYPCQSSQYAKFSFKT